MNKRELVKWAENEKLVAVRKANEECDKLIKETKEYYYEQLGVNEFVKAAVPHFKEAFAEYEKFFKKIDDTEGVRISRFNWKKGYHEIESLTYEKVVKDSIIDALTFSMSHECIQKQNEAKHNVREVENTYDTVIETLKNLPTSKDGMEYLQKLGFDISKIEAKEGKKQLPATVSVNVDTKYLLLDSRKSL